MWKKTRICVLLFVLFVFSVRIFSSSETKPTGFLLSYEKLFPKQMTSTAVESAAGHSSAGDTPP